MAVRVRHVLQLDLLPDVLHDLHDLSRPVPSASPRDREDGQHHGRAFFRPGCNTRS
ncbi:MAG: hypothetical protein ACLS3C_03430 [Oscillospiraceae bacterium]